jgi:hypothetical protein
MIRFPRVKRWVVFVFLLFAVTGCAIVPQTRRRWLADPTMQPTESSLEDKARRKLHITREGAAGGDGEPAGGGCGCGN